MPSSDEAALPTLLARLDALEARTSRQGDQLDRIEAILRRLEVQQQPQPTGTPSQGPSHPPPLVISQEASLDRSGRLQSTVFGTREQSMAFTPRPKNAVVGDVGKTVGRIYSHRMPTGPATTNALTVPSSDDPNIQATRVESTTPDSVADLVPKQSGQQNVSSDQQRARRKSRVGFADSTDKVFASTSLEDSSGEPALPKLAPLEQIVQLPASAAAIKIQMEETNNPLQTSGMDAMQGTQRDGKRKRRQQDAPASTDVPLCRFLEKVPPVDSNHDLVYIGDAAYIILSFAACCVAVVSLSPDVGFAQNDVPHPGFIVWVILLALISLALMIVRGGFVRKKTGKDEIADTHMAIARAYARSWLVPDLLVSIPFELLFIGWLNPAFYYVQSKHFLRLLRLQSLIRSSNPLLPGRPTLLFITLTGCCFLLLFIIAVIFGAVDEDGRPLATALYWATATFTSTGYGDIPVLSQSSRGFAVAAMCVSTLLLSFVQAMSTSLLTSRDVTQEDLTRKKQTMYFMLNHYGVPWDVQKDVVFTFPAVLESHREHLFKEMIQDLPPSVTTKLEFYIKARVVHETSYFANLFRAAPESADTIIAAVADLLSIRKLNTGDFLVQPMHPCLELLLVQSGVVEVLHCGEEGDEVIATLRRGMTIGSIACHSPDDLEWTVAAQAVQPCEVYTLHRVDYHSLMARYPVLRFFRGDATTKTEVDWTTEVSAAVGGETDGLAAVTSMSDASSFRFGGGSFAARPRRKSLAPSHHGFDTDLSL